MNRESRGLKSIRWLFATLLVALTACSSQPAKPDKPVDKNAAIERDEIEAIGVVAFDQVKAKSRLNADYAVQSYVRCVADKLIAVMPEDYALQDWEILVFEEPGAFAFALPGARLGVHAELLRAAPSEAQLATALSHVLAHVQLEHFSGRVASAMNAEAAEVAAQVFRGSEGPGQSRTVYSMLGLGNRVGVAVPFSAGQEQATDALSVKWLQAAGYSAGQAKAFWEGWSKGGPERVAWLAQHPHSEARAAAGADSGAAVSAKASCEADPANP
jgi:predicted Zn-dependent protease